MGICNRRTTTSGGMRRPANAAADFRHGLPGVAGRPPGGFRRSTAVSRILFRPARGCPRARRRRPFLWPRHLWRDRATYPEASDGPSSSASLFGLAPCGVWPATRLAAGAVRSYRTFSPLPATGPTGRGGRYVFCATFLQVALTGCCPAHCPVEFGLSSPRPRRNAGAQRSSGRLRRNVKEPFDGLSTVRLLPDIVLLQLLVEVAARRVDCFGGA